MEQEIYSKPPAALGWGKYLKGCAIAAALVCAALIALLIYLSRMPAVQSMATCGQNITTLGQALRRYHDANNTYPASLADLKDEYLSDSSVLKCPEDKSGKGAVSYTYHKPPADAPSTFVIIECNRHRPIADAPPVTLKLRLDEKLLTETQTAPSAKPAKN